MSKTDVDILQELHCQWKGTKADKIVKMPQSGSDRQYYRLFNNDASILGVVNNNTHENNAYIDFSRSFLKAGISVPKIIRVSDDAQAYLVEDIGDDSLYARVIASKGNFTNDLGVLYKKALSGLIKMQTNGGESINYNLCYPVSEFDETAIQWDLNYFKYNFLKLANIEHNELLLEHDFKVIKSFLLNIPREYFMFRDFQSRNILLSNNEPVFIDFQGGRKGPLTYDVASLLYQAKAQIPDINRMELFDFYVNELGKKIPINYDEQLAGFKGFALLRTLQVLGAYGYRGYFEKKAHFIESIPYALNNLKSLLNTTDFPMELPHIKKLANSIALPKRLNFNEANELTVSITSFSYKKGIPADPSTNGGGFVFDCRSIHNPGRYDEYKQLTGKDQAVIDFFERENEMDAFLDSVFALVDNSVEIYVKRNFKHLMVNFGCTGGQHRSVYSAERLKAHLEKKHKIKIQLWHREQDK